MLVALSIRDFAIIDRVEIELGPGLTVITGETGAGKSILVNALNLVLGGRVGADVIRTGADTAEVEALFSLDNAPEAHERLAAAGLDAEQELVVRRVLSRNRRHRTYINGNLATLGMLGQIVSGLVDISGQHEHHSLLRTDFHLELLDRVSGLRPLLTKVKDAHDKLLELDRRHRQLVDQQRGRAEREDFLRFQLQDLEAAHLEDPNEEQTLDRECGVLRNAERLRQTSFEAEQALYADHGSAVDRLGRAARRIRELSVLDDGLRTVADDLETALALTQDAARALSSYAHRVECNPQRLDEIESRLALLSRLRRKYGCTLPDLIDLVASIHAELATLEAMDDHISAAERQRRKAGDRLLAVAQTLTAARRRGASKLAKAVATELDDLGMDGATLSIEITPTTAGLEAGGAHIGPKGADRAEFRLSANPGEAPQPLNRIASGGELSRFMLAVKRVIAEIDPVSTYIFDEVDTGVGGPTAEAIGRKLQAVATRRQAICITHLPQIAVFADTHLRVAKHVSGQRTQSEVQRLEGSQRIAELARMLGGAHITQTTLAHAEELLRLTGP